MDLNRITFSRDTHSWICFNLKEPTLENEFKFSQWLSKKGIAFEPKEGLTFFPKDQIVFLVEFREFLHKTLWLEDMEDLVEYNEYISDPLFQVLNPIAEGEICRKHSYGTSSRVGCYLEGQGNSFVMAYHYFPAEDEIELEFNDSKTGLRLCVRICKDDTDFRGWDGVFRVDWIHSFSILCRRGILDGFKMKEELLDYILHWQKTVETFLSFAVRSKAVISLPENWVL